MDQRCCLARVEVNSDLLSSSLVDKFVLWFVEMKCFVQHGTPHYKMKHSTILK